MSQRLLANTDQLNIVKNVSLFSGLTEEERSVLLKGAAVHSYPRKKTLFREGDQIKSLYIVLSGIVQEFRETLDGREITVNIHKTGDVFCKTGMFLKGSFHHTNTRAIDTVLVMELPIEQFKENLQKYESVASRLLSSLAQFAVMKQVEVEQQATMTATQLLATYLRQICETHGLDPRGFTLPYKKSLIASRLGIELETLSRALPRLKEHGITVRGSYVTFNNIPAPEQDLVKHFPMPVEAEKRAYAL